MTAWTVFQLLLSVTEITKHPKLTSFLFHLQGKLGELLISLCYQPTVGRITIVVMKARELKAKDITGTSGI